MECPECKSVKIYKFGSSMTRQGRKKRVQCQDCGKTFYNEEVKNEQTEACNEK
jgi:transposase-like protein